METGAGRVSATCRGSLVIAPGWNPCVKPFADVRKIGVAYLTLYAFSSENWTRPTLEVRGLMQLLRQYLKKELAELHANGVQLRTIGRTEALPQGAQRELAKAIAATAGE